MMITRNREKSGRELFVDFSGADMDVEIDYTLMSDWLSGGALPWITL